MSWWTLILFLGNAPVKLESYANIETCKAAAQIAKAQWEPQQGGWKAFAFLCVPSAGAAKP